MVSTIRYLKNDVIVLSLSISTIINEAKHVLKCLKVISLFLYYEPFTSFAHYAFGILVFFLLICRHSLYIMLSD